MRETAGATLLVALLCSFLSAAAWAEDKKEEPGFEAYSLGEVYVTGEKTPVTQETAITNVITAEDIKATNSKTVAEALTYVPGLRVTSGNKNEPNISLHGVFDQSRILVMIDGVPYYETKYGKLDLNEFLTDNVAKIEITKGAASVLYGANAMGGVINIITKQPTGKPVFILNAEGGEVDYYKGSVSHGMSTEKLYYWLNYGHSRSRGWPMSDDFVPRTGSIVSGKKTLGTGIFEDGGTRNQSDYKTDSLWAKFGITPTAGSDYSINCHYIKREKGNPPSLDTVTLFTTRPQFSNFFRYLTFDDWGIDLSGQQKVTEQLTFKAKLFYHNHVDELQSFSDQTFTQPIALSKYMDYTIGGSLITEYKPLSWNTARLALNYRGDSHKQRDDTYLPFEDFFSWTGSVGLEDELALGKNFRLVVGASYDWFKVTDANSNNTDSSGNFTGQSHLATKPTKSSLNPMIGVTYAFTDTTKVFASAAHKTRFPTLNNLFASASKGGNPDLKAEKAINYTAGVSHAFGNIAWAELAFFYHDISDLIERSGPNKSDPYMNFQKVEVYGLEANTELYPTDSLTLKLAYNYNHARDKSSNKVTDKVRNVPEHKVDMGAQYTLPFLKTRLDVNGVLFSNLYSQLPTPSKTDETVKEVAGYFFLNARATQKLSDSFEIYVAVNNVFDRNYEPEAGFPAQGRNIFGGITARF